MSHLIRIRIQIDHSPHPARRHRESLTSSDDSQLRGDFGLPGVAEDGLQRSLGVVDEHGGLLARLVPEHLEGEGSEEPGPPAGKQGASGADGIHRAKKSPRLRDSVANTPSAVPPSQSRMRVQSPGVRWHVPY